MISEITSNAGVLGVAAFTSGGELKCDNSLTMEKLKTGYSPGFSFSGAALTHDGDKAFVVSVVENVDPNDGNYFSQPCHYSRVRWEMQPHRIQKL
ncbi:hypothetical protein ACAM_0216 [Aeropyrum camini SY1 = JCM 12091]|uniref:Uncharacterized protein n=1 Tax=Aeropyrum camini SY1 = JCM 12091 TaxID=1198449 RepID=U3TCD3_9CREN|nr:hypothetical protein ACAM_0216 [Aeropyrum camini SY1 = JCM 12091]